MIRSKRLGWCLPGALLLLALAAGCAGLEPGPPPRPQAPTLVQPVADVPGGRTVHTRRPTLEWRPAPGAQGYAVYISERDRGGYRLIYSSEERRRELIRGNRFTVPAGVLRDNGSYRWNARAWNRSGWSPYSASHEFQVQVYTDSELRSLVLDNLRRAPNVDSRRIDVYARDGEVTLRGCVPHRRQRGLAREVTAVVGGVRRVVNELRVCR
jgi:hypothetical protein